MDLSHAVMLKDNHFAACNLAPHQLIAVMRRAGHTVKIVAEATSPAMAAELAGAGADVVLLDNFSPGQVKDAVAQIAGASLVEVSGGIDEQNIAEYLLPGVDVISVGALTHSYNSLDISLEVN
jgi:nicotinate-nucleotide pyrophosphorylase (carboxylating)